MFRNYRHRLVTVLFALVSLLFAQLALAGYACPGSGSKAAEVSATAEAGMPCADAMRTGMDEEQPNLCHAHCQAGQQTANTYQMPALASLPNPGADYLIHGILPVSIGNPLQEPHLRRATAPPLAIWNCCFRI